MFLADAKQRIGFFDMRERCLHARIVRQQQRATLELEQEVPDEDTADADDGRDIEPMQMELGLVERWSNRPEDVDRAHREQKKRDRTKHPRVALVAPRKQDRKWRREVKRDQSV